jgi:hypothetical protein
MKDELTSKLKNGFYVINSQSSNNSNGTHRTALYYSSKHSYSFNPFGFLAPIEEERKLNIYKYSDKQIQNSKSTACGFYCLAFILIMCGRKNIEFEIGFKLFAMHFQQIQKERQSQLPCATVLDLPRIKDIMIESPMLAPPLTDVSTI